MTTSITLIGGGWDPAAARLLYGPFLADAGPNPEIACIVIDEGDGQEQFQRWSNVLVEVAPCRPVPVLIPIGEQLRVAALSSSADGLLVCGGLTPAYAKSLAPVAGELAVWLKAKPYCGFSAGSAVAARQAVVGGWLTEGRPLVSPDVAEDLEGVTVVAGLNLVSFTVDVHAGDWGTLPRLLEAAQRSHTIGLAIDENTAVRIDAHTIAVVGLGHVHVATPADGGMFVRRLASGDTV